jgi:hypothetical protein
MVITSASSKTLHRQAWLLVEIVIAMGILVLVMIPRGYSFAKEQQLARAYYFRAIAMEIIDGEMEVLAAGAWHQYPPGTHPYSVEAEAAVNLPDGRFTLTRSNRLLRLEWTPEKRGKGGAVVRQIQFVNANQNED